MKKLFIILIFFSVILSSKAQSFSSTYIETNLGLAALQGEFDGVFPGASVLFGYQHISHNNVVFDTEIGLAFPSLVTAKIGMGWFDDRTNTVLSAGIRPWPTHLYAQAEFINQYETRSWVVSIEPSASTLFGSKFDDASLYTSALVNVGYRFIL